MSKNAIGRPRGDWLDKLVFLEEDESRKFSYKEIAALVGARPRTVQKFCSDHRISGEFVRGVTGRPVKMIELADLKKAAKEVLGV